MRSTRVCRGAAMAALAAGTVAGTAGAPAAAATVFQPDFRLGVSYLDNGGFTGTEDVNATGAEVHARARIGFVDERNQLLLIPVVRLTEYNEDRVTDREEQRLTLNWYRDFQTGASNTIAEYRRQDLFSSEFRDIELDPDEIPDFDESDSGVVDVETTRERLHFRQDFAKALGPRNGVALALDYADVSYDDSSTTPRVDFDEVQVDAGWRVAVSERSDFRVIVGAEKYDGDNGATADSLSGELGFGYDLSETSNFFVNAGYENIDREADGLDLGSEGEFIFSLGGARETELSRFRARVERNVRPTSIGGVRTETGLALYVDRNLSQRLRFGAGISAFRQERDRGELVDDDRDYVTGKLELAWQLTREWSLEMSARHIRQDFDSREILGGGTTEDRTRLFLNFRYRGLSEVPLRRDSRFIRRGY